MLDKIVIDWANIHTVFLDMDGTLLDLHYDNHFWLEYVPLCYANKHQITVDQAKSQLKSRYGAIRGTLNWYCVDYWSKQLDMDMILLKTKIAKRIKVRPSVKTFLSFLQQQKKEIVLLTNAPPKTIALKFQYTALSPYFNQVISSHPLGLAKEQQGFWNKLQQNIDFNPSRSLFIDDNLEVLRAAQQHPIAHLLAIHQPDSQQNPMDTQEFTAIQCFRQLF